MRAVRKESLAKRYDPPAGRVIPSVVSRTGRIVTLNFAGDTSSVMKVLSVEWPRQAQRRKEGEAEHKQPKNQPIVPRRRVRREKRQEALLEVLCSRDEG